MNASKHTHTQRKIFLITHAPTHTCTHTHKHMRMHPHAPTHKHARVHAHMHAHTHSHSHTHSLSHTHTHTQTHTMYPIICDILSSLCTSSLLWAASSGAIFMPSVGTYNTVLPSSFQRVSVRLARNLCSWAEKSFLMPGAGQGNTVRASYLVNKVTMYYSTALAYKYKWEWTCLLTLLN